MGSHRVGHDWSDLAAAAAMLSVYSSVPYKSRPFLVLKTSWEGQERYQNPKFHSPLEHEINHALNLTQQTTHSGARWWFHSLESTSLPVHSFFPNLCGLLLDTELLSGPSLVLWRLRPQSFRTTAIHNQYKSSCTGNEGPALTQTRVSAKQNREAKPFYERDQHAKPQVWEQLLKI